MNYLSLWGPGLVGLQNGHNTHTLLAFLVLRSQPCLGWVVGAGGGESNLEYALPDFQEAKAVSICLGTWGWDSSEYKNALYNLTSARLEAVWGQWRQRVLLLLLLLGLLPCSWSLSSTLLVLKALW